VRQKKHPKEVFFNWLIQFVFDIVFTIKSSSKSSILMGFGFGLFAVAFFSTSQISRRHLLLHYFQTSFRPGQIPFNNFKGFFSSKANVTSFSVCSV
jgi:hypothetical protein